jgi:hypothetical protein
VVAVAHSILKSVYYILRDGVLYNELGADYLNSKIEKRRRKYLQSELEKMGYKVQLVPSDPVGPTG